MIIAPADNGEILLSGTLSYFDHERGAEIAFPLHYMTDEDSDYEQFTADIHYRKFLDEEIGGIYFSGFARVAHLDGYTTDHQAPVHTTQTKAGVGVGLGYRYFSSGSFYWGASLSAGRYLGSNSDLDYDSSMIIFKDDQALILDVEFFKFGYSF